MFKGACSNRRVLPWLALTTMDSLEHVIQSLEKVCKAAGCEQSGSKLNQVRYSILSAE